MSRRSSKSEGGYSNKSRGVRLKAAQALAPQPVVAAEEGSAPARSCNFNWAKLIKRVYEVDPLLCPECGATMKVISFIEPPQEEVIRRRPFDFAQSYGGTSPEDTQALRPVGGAGSRPAARGATVDRDNVAQALTISA